ncbi:MAG: phosphoribosylformylglycinamidine synthase [Coxiella-like endosymbiont]
MLFLQGANAYTAFRQQQIFSSLQQKEPSIRAIKAKFGYFVDCDDSRLNSNDLDRLECLLPNAYFCHHSQSSEDCAFWVVPRIGTISSWSSKATDIANNCKIPVNRIERGIYYVVQGISPTDEQSAQAIILELYDPLVESILFSADDLALLFEYPLFKTFNSINLLEKEEIALKEANQNFGLALSNDDINYLLSAFKKLNRNPTDVELMMFAQINSEHCRHKIFNAEWTIDRQHKDESLFSMIRYTHKTHPDQVMVAYRDNAAVIKGSTMDHFSINPANNLYGIQKEFIHTVLKVETHNHPTAISPFAGAATGSGGEIRDEAATGRGAQSQVGLTGFSVSHLKIPSFLQPWEIEKSKPKLLASALDIMLHGPIGAASFNNEFGRPNVCGYFRTLEYGQHGYHKPIMIAGGIGHIRHSQIEKENFDEGALLIIMGGPAMLIGLGGGSASSRNSEAFTESLDFASVQRSNPEMQRRAQEVINVCTSLGSDNPILSIHDVGAGGLSNALSELVYTTGCGGEFELRDIPSVEPGMTPLEIWCNEAQERFVLAIRAESLRVFHNIAKRERCPFAVVGRATRNKKLIVNDEYFNNQPINLPLSLLFKDIPPLQCADKQLALPFQPAENITSSQVGLFSYRSSCRMMKGNHGEQLKTWDVSSDWMQSFDVKSTDLDWSKVVKRILQYPCVSDKSFLITIGDRTVGGMVVRDQMVGPWQVPVSDVAVITHSFTGFQGQALAIGERSPIAIIHPAASARMAIGEAITNIAAAGSIETLSHLVLSANWMAAADAPGEGAGLYEAVRTVSKELCPALGICIPVGKDSLSMKTTWVDEDQNKTVTSPLSLIITAIAPVIDVRNTLTPQLQIEARVKTKLLLIDLGGGANSLGGSCLAQTYNLLGQQPPDVDDPILLRHFFEVIQFLSRKKLLLAYHDRSDGGLFVTICEMAFAGRIGVTIKLDSLGTHPIASAFTEELGAVIQVKEENVEEIFTTLEKISLKAHAHIIGETNDSDEIVINFQEKILYQETRTTLQKWWSETSYRLQSLRDNPDCAKQQFDYSLNKKNLGLTAIATFDIEEDIVLPYLNKGKPPRVAILREQGINGHREMAAAFYLAGFESVDVHMSDLLSGEVNLVDFKGLVACGGFSFGDVLGAGRGWAQSILMHSKMRDEFASFFHNSDRFALGICNGCQLFSHLKSLIPGAQNWPAFERNTSEQFEARLALVEISESPSIFFKDMAGSQLPIAVAHGEGRAVFQKKGGQLIENNKNKLIALRYVDYNGQPTEIYSANPNGSPEGITGLTIPDGRITILMPHPERVFRTVQLSWHPQEWKEMSPWMRMFRNARVWAD